MNRRVQEVRKRIADRRRNGGKEEKPQRKFSYDDLISDEENYSGERFPTYEYNPESKEHHPLFSPQWFLFKLLTSFCLVLIVAILFRNPAVQLDGARTFVEDTMEESFQFAKMSAWYEEKFGEPLALIPKSVGEEPTEEANSQYVVPASGNVVETFASSKKGVTVETGSQTAVQAMDAGFVKSIEEKKDFGNTVSIQHADGSESWYSGLANIDVKTFDFIEKGQVIGKVKTEGDDKKGSYGFALYKDGKFMDPSKVISFE
ncbi:M23 family metallopeptidase [Priestia filamentosa]|uniref:M23ase beta-sheet core domain-containing protein n=1 Tax=Priestia filamentosa TaxID=1402861 RepID=A0A1X7CU64_9BACI|nr:M23 family metallopeptidase [Priestia filamentosa]AKO94280.1 hypothetical protein BEH_20585 [Priestia filamentosa]MDT3764560.1 M23 family metallopeptidase [Priestia filamentosa]OXS70990.1 hypothetical protein B1B01_01370 [Priestia filamentosa]RJS66625.1 M23 family peptidase [Priestia filamentosa]WCM15172.1 M23 family metallopeptidase [Priestia filamentosa]